MGLKRFDILASVVCGAALVVALGAALRTGFVHGAVWSRPLATLASLGVAALLVGIAPLRAALRKIVERVATCPPPVFVSCIILVATVSFAYIARQLFQGLPHMDDGVAALYQARLFLEGRMSQPVDPELRQFFKLFGIVDVATRPGTVAGMYPPAWPALLAAGELVRAPWLVNPLLGAVLAVAVYGLGRELYTERIARLAACLTALSPWVGVLAATHLSHVATALGVTAGWWAVCRLLDTSRVRYGVAAGAAFGVAFLCRPVTTLVVAGVVILFAFSHRRQLRAAWRGAVVATLVVAASVATLAAFQGFVSGDPLTPAHAVEMGSRAKLGFGPIDDTGAVHSLVDGARLTFFRLEAIDQHLLGWPLLSLLVAFLPFILRRARVTEVWLLLPFVLLTLIFAMFWYYEAFYPGRYLFAAAPLLVLLAARGLALLGEELADHRRLARLPELAAVWGVVFAITTGAPAYHATFGPHHGDVETNLPAVIAAHQVSNAVVFMASTGETNRAFERQNDYYASGFMHNTLALDGDVIYARDGADRKVDDANERLIARYPDRTYYHYEFDRARSSSQLYRYSVTDDGRISGREALVPAAGVLSAAVDAAPRQGTRR